MLYVELKKASLMILLTGKEFHIRRLTLASSQISLYSSIWNIQQQPTHQLD